MAFRIEKSLSLHYSVDGPMLLGCTKLSESELSALPDELQVTPAYGFRRRLPVTFPDFWGWSAPMVSSRLKGAIEELEPGRHQFKALRLRAATNHRLLGEKQGFHYLNVLSFVAAHKMFAPMAAEYLDVRERKSIRYPGKVLDRTYDYDVMRVPGTAHWLIDKHAIQGLHIFKTTGSKHPDIVGDGAETRSSGWNGLLISDQLASKIEQMKPIGFEPSYAKEV